MKAIILSAGQGSRLMPLTEVTPKCCLRPWGDVSILEWQISQLAVSGIDEVVVVTGVGQETVEVVVGQVEIGAVVGMDEGDVRIGWAVVLGDDFPHTVGVGEERCCSLVDVEVLLARCGALRSGSASGRAQYSRDG